MAWSDYAFASQSNRACAIRATPEDFSKFRDTNSTYTVESGTSPLRRGEGNNQLTVNFAGGKTAATKYPKRELRVKKALISMLVSAAMVIAPLPAMAADSSPANTVKTGPVAQTGPLTPGGAAGVQLASGRDDDNPPLIWLIGAGIVIGVAILILTENNHGHSLPQITPATATTRTGGRFF